MRRMKNDTNGLIGLIITIVVIASIIIGIAATVSWYQVRERTITVDRMYETSEYGYRFNGHDENGNKYVYEVDSVILLGVWNEDEVWAQLEEGETVKVTYCGWYIPWADTYPVVFRVSEV